jgi:hypothetical protein
MYANKMIACAITKYLTLLITCTNSQERIVELIFEDVLYPERLAERVSNLDKVFKPEMLIKLRKFRTEGEAILNHEGGN